jgi:hypothetical protein
LGQAKEEADKLISRGWAETGWGETSPAWAKHMGNKGI